MPSLRESVPTIVFAGWFATVAEEIDPRVQVTVHIC